MFAAVAELLNDLLRDQLQTALGTAYTLERELGGGGMARVFVAEDTRLRRQIVIKVLAPELATGLSAERFEREVGRGGMATVYLARDSRHERKVAIKFLDPELGAVLVRYRDGV